MKNNKNKVVTTSQVVEVANEVVVAKGDHQPATIANPFPQALMSEGVKLAKSASKLNKSFAELASLCIVESVDWQALIKFAFVEAGGVDRDARGAITNCSKFIAASLAVRQGKMGAREFASLKTDVASAAFKQAGGMKDGGLEPDKWLEAYHNPTPKTGMGGGEGGGGEGGGGEGGGGEGGGGKPMSPDAFVLALCLQKREEMTKEGRIAAASALLINITKAELAEIKALQA